MRFIFSGALQEVLRQYHEKADLTKVPLRLDVIRDIIQNLAGFNAIAWQEVDVESQNLLGYVKFHYQVPKNIRTNEPPTAATIRFSSKLNLCWQRFVICKEMFHCLIDDETELVSDTKTLVKLTEDLATRMAALDTGIDGPMLTEGIAEILALEMLFPLELRQHHIADFRANKISAYQLALRYRIPEIYAEFGMLQSRLDWMQNKVRKGKLITLSS
jgi:hypothetical protein